MHIALLSPAWPLEKYQNGIITYVHWMKHELETRGHRVSVFTPICETTVSDERIYHVASRFRDKVRYRLSQLHIGRPNHTYSFGAAIAAAILRVHRNDPIDVIESEESFGWFSVIQKHTSLPVLVKLHGPAFLTLQDETNTPAGAERVLREGAALVNATVLASPSKITLTRTIQRYGLKPTHVKIIANPINVDRDIPLWKLDRCDRDTILFVGRFDKVKGADILLIAFLALLQIRPNTKLIFAGPDRGWTDPDGTRVRLSSFLAELFPKHLIDRIDYKGEVPNHEVAQLRTQAMVTVIASRWENQSYALLEAMLQGCPVVCTDAGGCPESIVDGITGRLARSEDPRDLAAKLCSVLENPDFACVLGLGARAHIVQYHSVSKIADQSLELYTWLKRQSAGAV